ncbi:hypothetical protein M432DRAFT_38436 [Thermoascus aurantiacus ATCC 26904]
MINNSIAPGRARDGGEGMHRDPYELQRVPPRRGGEDAGLRRPGALSLVPGVLGAPSRLPAPRTFAGRSWPRLTGLPCMPENWWLVVSLPRAPSHASCTRENNIRLVRDRQPETLGAGNAPPGVPSMLQPSQVAQHGNIYNISGSKALHRVVAATPGLLLLNIMCLLCFFTPSST